MVVAIAQMLVLLNMTTTIASLGDNGECSNKRNRKLEDHFVCVLLFLFPIRCVMQSMQRMPYDIVRLVTCPLQLMIFVEGEECQICSDRRS